MERRRLRPRQESTGHHHQPSCRPSVRELGYRSRNRCLGDKAWDGTSKNYAGVLANLQKEYGGDHVAASKKKDKKRKRREEKQAKKKTASADEGSEDNAGRGGGGGSLRLAQNKVQAGHARKMRDANDISNKSAADMAAVFGVKADFYKGLNASIKEDSIDCDVHGNDIKEKKKSKKRKNRDKDGECEEASSDGERRKKKKKSKKTKAE